VKFSGFKKIVFWQKKCQTFFGFLAWFIRKYLPFTSGSATIRTSKSVKSWQKKWEEYKILRTF